jgi:hypothetical protein
MLEFFFSILVFVSVGIVRFFSLVAKYPILFSCLSDEQRKKSRQRNSLTTKERQKSEKDNPIHFVLCFFPRFLEVLHALSLCVVIKWFRYTNETVNFVVSKCIEVKLGSPEIIRWKTICKELLFCNYSCISCVDSDFYCLF